MKKKVVLVKKKPVDVLKQERIQLQKQKDATEQKKKMQALFKENDILQAKLEFLNESKKLTDTLPIKYKSGSSSSEAIAVVLASDWHLEEPVYKEKVNGLNDFNLQIAEQRAKEFFQNTLRLVEKEKTSCKIDTLVLALLGDFFSGFIHKELEQTCLLTPPMAAIFAQKLLASGIKFLLENSDLKLIIPCHVGNHSRTTIKVQFANEQAMSYETIMYYNLEEMFSKDKRVEFRIADSYRSFHTFYDNYTICFEHGHSVSYMSGIGGLAVPLRRALYTISNNNPANLYCMGHHHTYLDIGLAVVNGSLIGFNTYAVYKNIPYERPKQAFFLISKKYNCKTVTTPILFSI